MQCKIWWVYICLKEDDIVHKYPRLLNLLFHKIPPWKKRDLPMKSHLQARQMSAPFGDRQVNILPKTLI